MISVSESIRKKTIVKNNFALKINTISQNTSFSTYLGQINGRIAGWSTIKKVCLFKKICFGIHRTGVGGLVDWDLCSIIKKHANFRHILQKVQPSAYLGRYIGTRIPCRCHIYQKTYNVITSCWVIKLKICTKQLN